MAQWWAVDFYNSISWKETRRDYFEYAHGLCEECARRGIVTPAAIVHHVIHLTQENISDINITLNWCNLLAVCRECHARLHGWVKSATRDG